MRKRTKETYKQRDNLYSDVATFANESRPLIPSLFPPLVSLSQEDSLEIAKEGYGLTVNRRNFSVKDPILAGQFFPPVTMKKSFPPLIPPLKHFDAV